MASPLATPHEDRSTGVMVWAHSREARCKLGAACILSALLCVFITLQFLLPLRTAVQIGADEGFELAKATLCLNGHKLYTEIWNDQPPLHTFIVTQVLKHTSSSVLGPRLITVGFTGLLLVSLFMIILRVTGLSAAVFATGLLIVSPGFLELSSSCMLEIPSLGMAMAGIAILVIGNPGKWRFREVGCGVLFGLGLLIKLLPVILLPLTAVILWFEETGTQRRLKETARSLLVVGASLGCIFLVTDFLIERGVFLTHFGQTWASHFGGVKSFDYGSPAEHRFDWSLVLKNWDTTVPAVFGLIVLIRETRKSPMALLPLGWLAVTFGVFALHKPWWAYYYIHTAIPLCWCAGAGLSWAWEWLWVSRLKAVFTKGENSNAKQAPRHDRVKSMMSARSRTGGARRKYRKLPLIGLGGVFLACAVWWAGSRVVLEVQGMRNSPRIYTELVLSEIARYKPQWMYADREIYSFHAGVPMPPQLAVLSLKRFWAGEMSNDRLIHELTQYQPGVILLVNDGRKVPFQQLLDREYHLAYFDAEHRLYTLLH